MKKLFIVLLMALATVFMAGTAFANVEYKFTVDGSGYRTDWNIDPPVPGPAGTVSVEVWATNIHSLPNEVLTFDWRLVVDTTKAAVFNLIPPPSPCLAIISDNGGGIYDVSYYLCDCPSGVPDELLLLTFDMTAIAAGDHTLIAKNDNALYLSVIECTTGNASEGVQGVATIHNTAPPCTVYIAPHAATIGSFPPNNTRLFTASSGGFCDNASMFIFTDTCYNGDVDPMSGLFTATQTFEQEYCRVYVEDTANSVGPDCADVHIIGDLDNDFILDLADNCPDTPNGPDLGTCVREIGSIITGAGVTCTDNSTCGEGEYCQMEQGDINENGVGDACECYADFNDNARIDGGDVFIVVSEANAGLRNCNSNALTSPPCCYADANGNGRLDGEDMFITVSEANASKRNCPIIPHCPNVPDLPSALYLEIDVSGGPGASSYPVTELSSQPPLTDDYKTAKILLRKIDVSGTPFLMGSPENETGRQSNETRHQVTLTQGYYMGVFEITQRQYELVMGSTPSYYTGDMRPVEYVSWNTIRGGTWPGSPAGSGQPAADTFIDKFLSKTGLNFDLPTEAQWEYAARATTIRAFNDYTQNGGEGADCTVPIGGADPNLDPLGRYAYNGGQANQHAIVGSYLPNLWGLFDMHGNVYEWNLDWYDSYSGDEIDPLGPGLGSNRVYRGGSWFYGARYCRSSNRNNYYPSFISFNLGFRLALSQ